MTPLADGHLEVDVRQQDVGGFAAQFLGHALDGVGGGLGDQDAGAGGAGEAHHVDIRVGRHGGADVWGRRPLTRLNTPFGTPAACITSAQMMAFIGAISLGFSTIVQPAAMAGATLQTIWLIGQFQGGDQAADADRLLGDEGAAAEAAPRTRRSASS